MKKAVLFLGCFLTVGGLAFAAPARQVTVGPESTVYGIAYEHGIPTRALIAANNLKTPYVLIPGQTLIIPAPHEHVVGRGETPQSIAEEYGVDVDVLTQENGATVLRPGETLSIPSRDTTSMAKALRPPVDNISTSSLDPLPSVRPAPPTAGNARMSSVAAGALPNDLAEEIAREKGQPLENAKPMLVGNMTQRNAGAPTAATTRVREEVEVEEKPKKEVKKKAPPKQEKKKAEPVIAKEEKQESPKQPQFAWPVQGTVTRKFSAGKNDGIKIKVDEGTDIMAAAAGDVLYAGSELKGFGNLLLLKHKDGWVTAYAHNSSLLVKKGDKVKQGQVIAKSGKTGDAKEPQLHFEIRKGKQPVDPLAQLES
jgi:murein DD-endopeptidase MepM/ murein hydrolase activator NlpD